MLAPHRLTPATTAIKRRPLPTGWISACVALFLMVFGIAPALATNGTWIDTTSGGLWSATGDWSGGIIANGTDGIADFSTLNITSDDTIHLDTARTIGQLKFGDTTPSNNWILDNDGSAVDILTLAVTSGTPTITVNDDTTTISAVLAGSQGLAKSGAGVLLLSGNNTFLGSVTVSAGTLALGNGGALTNGATAVSVSAGATLDLGGQTIGTNALSISGTGVGGNGALINSSASAASFDGTVTVSAPFRVGGSGDITLSGSVNSGTNILTKIGSNTLILSGSTDNNNLAVTVNSGTVVLAKASGGSPTNVHAVGQPGLIVNGGTAQLGGTGSDQIYDVGSVTVTSGAFDTSGRGETFATLKLQGSGIGNAGALVDSAAGLSVIEPTGGTTLTANATIGVTQSAGELGLYFAIGGNFALTKTGLGTLLLFDNSTFSGGLAIQQGMLAVGVVTNNAGTNGVLGNNTSVTLGSSGQTGTLEFDEGRGSTTSNMPFTLAAGGTGGFYVSADSPIQLSGAISGAGAMFVTGGGTLTLSGNNTFTGGVTINNGSTLQVGSAGALNASTPNVVTFGAATSGETGGPILTLGGFSVAVGGLNAVADNSGYLPTVQNASPTAAALTVNISGALNDSFDGVLADGSGGGPLSLIKAGTGTQTLVGANTYTGTTTISGGTLRLGGDGITTIGTIASTTVVNNGVLEFAVPLTPSLPNFKYTYSGNISGAGSLVKSGPGTLTLAGNNSYTGTTTISGGTLAMSGGSLTSNVLNQATFAYSGGTFGGRLTNLGTAVFNADFIAGNGMENDGVATIAGVNLTFNGAGLDNEGTLTVTSGSVTLSGAANVNRGNLNLSALILTSAKLANNGSLALAGGSVSGASGMLTNGVGGSISGTGTISSGFSNTGGVLALSSGTMNISQPFSNSGMIELNGITADLVGGAITNSGTIQGFGNIGNAVTNTGTIEPIGGTLVLGGALTNAAGGLLTSGTGTKLAVTPGLATNGGVINLNGGTFDNNGFALNNIGQISGWGIFRTGGTGLDNNGSITFSGGITTVNGPVTNENGKTIVVAYNPAIFTGLVTNNGGGTFNIISTTAVFAGGSSGTISGTFTNNADSAFSEGGSGALEVDGAPALGAASSLAVNNSSTLVFKVTSGAATIGTGVTATVNNGATLELAGSVSALSNGPNRVNIANNSSASAGILVSGTHQQVGAIDGSGVTQVNAGSDLTANHIVQSALVIGGTAGSPGLVTIDASDSSGNPLDGAFSGLSADGTRPSALMLRLEESVPATLSSGFTLAGSLQPTAPFTSGAQGTSSLGPPSAEGFSGDPIPAGPAVDGTGGSPSAVPEPSALVLAALALCGLAARRMTRAPV